jgi:hypothetical protein
MTTRRRDKSPDDRLPEEHALSRAYDRAPREAPPAALDRAILAAARAAVAVPRGRASFAKRWAVPLSVAAVAVLSVTVVLRLSEQGALEPSRKSAEVAPASPSAAHGFLGQGTDELAQIRTDPKTAAMPVPPKGTPAKKERARELSESFAKATLETERRANAAPSAPATRTGVVETMANEKPTPLAPVPQQSERRTEAMDRAPVSEPLRASVAALKQETKAIGDRAEVISVKANGNPGAYEFVVGIRSPDSGCAQYADWWEVLGVDGGFLYRQVLAHSHVGEQPFVRAGGPVPIARDTVVWVRAHMNKAGYGGAAFKGSVATGFRAASLPVDFAAALAQQPPLPDGCAQ